MGFKLEGKKFAKKRLLLVQGYWQVSVLNMKGTLN